MADMNREDHLVGGEFIAPNASPNARKFILAARALMYSEGMQDALKRALVGDQYLADGAVPLIAMLVISLGRSIKPLTDADVHTIVVHLAGSLVDLAHGMGDPDADDTQAAVKDITEGVMLTLAGKAQEMQQAQGVPNGMPQPQESMPQDTPLLESANG